MRTLTADQLAALTARNVEIGWLIHIYARRDNPRVELPANWGSWCYSLGFGANVDFTDRRDYAGDGIQARTYVPAAIELDEEQTLRTESVELDSRSIELLVDPALEPFQTYLKREWPLTFGLVIYKVVRDGDTVKTVGSPALPVWEAFPFFLAHADEAVEDTFDKAGQRRLKTTWEFGAIWERECPRALFGVDCPKALFATGQHPLLDCNADKEHVRVNGTVTAINGNTIRAAAWGAKESGWFAQGVISYTATDPVSGKQFTFWFDVIASLQAEDETYSDLTLDVVDPPLLAVGVVVSAFGGCDRRRATCKTKHKPVGSSPADGNLQNFGGSDIPVEHPSMETSQ